MGVMVWRASLDPANPEHWGRVFWLMCVVTTLIGVVLAFFFHPRIWCHHSGPSLAGPLFSSPTFVFNVCEPASEPYVARRGST
jgi:hypothetical protein